MSFRELQEHAGYVADDAKVAAYRAAIGNVVNSGDRVLDLGTGSGLLGLLALEAGASELIAVDSGPILDVATEVFEANGFADRVSPQRTTSTALVNVAPVDVVVCDQIGGFAHEVGLTSVVQDLFARGIARPDASVIPAAFDLFVAPVEAPGEHHPVQPWNTNSTGFDFSPFARSAANTPFRLTAQPSWLLAPPHLGAQLEPTDTGTITVTATLDIERAGNVTGVLGMMRAHLDTRDGVTLSNIPDAPDAFNRWHLYHPFASPLPVSEGDHVTLSVEVHQQGELSRWSAEGPAGRRSGAQFLGAFLDPHTLTNPSTEPAQLNRRGRHHKLVLDAIANGHSFEATVQALTTTYGDDFATADHARRRVRETWGNYTD